MSTARLGYSVQLMEDSRGTDIHADNVDVLVSFENGKVYAATFFTLENIKRLMNRYQETGECLGGMYFWSSSMIVVRDLARETIEACVADLLASGEFESLFETDEPAHQPPQEKR